MFGDRYGRDVLAPDASDRASLRKNPKRRTSAPCEAEVGLVVEDVTSGFVGAVCSVERSGGMWVAVLEDRFGVRRGFPLGPGYWVNGQPVELVRPRPKKSPVAAVPVRTASGSRAVHDVAARVALSSRIWVEGLHDAELVEKIWGDDLRIEGVVVEPIHGADDLAARVSEFRPTPERRLGILLDHLVVGSKESQLAEQARLVGGDNVLIVGHPYVDIWQSIKPAVVGIDAWPTVDRSINWKVGILRHLQWPSEGPESVAMGWKRLLSLVTTYSDLEPELLGRVEHLIDFVTTPQDIAHE